MKTKIPSAGKDIREIEPYAIWVCIYVSSATLEIGKEAPQKIKYRANI